ncbi:MAG: DUF4157 domain-containing protein [Beijerinckiaceae bacterium]
MSIKSNATHNVSLRRGFKVIPSLAKTLSLATALFLSANANAIACGPNEYEECTLFCKCVPKLGGTIGDTAERWKNEARGQGIGNPLEAWFNASRDTALAGSAPIPQEIRLSLKGFSDEDALNRVRYRVQDDGALNLAHIIQQWRLYDVTAVTLIDVVVFRGPTEAHDICIWAHELVHVGQFRDWGTHNFAISYARNPNDVEDPAYATERECKRRLPAEPTRFNKPSGYFLKQGGRWIEYPAFAPGRNFTFEHAGYDAAYAYLIDKSRTKPDDPNIAMVVRLPINGGPAQWSYQNQWQWQNLFVVGPALN